jgi:hypothetical protein
MITEEKARKWLNEAIIERDNSRIVFYQDKNRIINDLIEKGKELGIIEKTKLEKVREIVKYYNEDNPYMIKKGKVKLKYDKIFNEIYRFKEPVKIIFVQDLNRIVALYESIIKEKE